MESTQIGLLGSVLRGIGERVGASAGTQTTICLYGASKQAQQNILMFLKTHDFTMSSTNCPGAHIHPGKESEAEYISVTFYDNMHKSDKKKGGE